MSGFSTLYTGVSGLQESHKAIITTTHNLANVETPGYVRQQVVFADRKYETLSVGKVYSNQVGHGVSVLDIRHLRDTLLDQAYREENGREAFYESQAQVIEEIEGYFGEMEGEQFQNYLKDLRDSIQEVSKNPLATETRATLVESAVSFISKANSIYSDLRNYQLTLNNLVKNSVYRINEIGESIDKLNRIISKIEVGGIESANDYRDKRDYLLDELSSMVDISYTELTNGIVKVKVEGVDLVTENGYVQMDIMHPDGESDPELVVPIWPCLGDKEVFNLTATVSTLKGNDIGSLKAFLLARGSAKANYTDVPNASDYENGEQSIEYLRKLKGGEYFAIRNSNGSLKSNFDGVGSFSIVDTNNNIDKAKVRELEKKLGKRAIDYKDYENGKDSKAYEEAMEYYDKYVIPSSIMTVMAEFDQLINSIVEGVNDLLSPTKNLESPVTVKDEKGNTVQLAEGIRVMDKEAAGYGKDDDMTQGTELFSRKNTKRYIEYYAYDSSNDCYLDENGESVGNDKEKAAKYYVYNYQSVFNLESSYSLSNLEVNPDVLGDNRLIPLSSKENGAEFRELCDQLNALWEKNDLTLIPEYSSKKGFMDYYSEFKEQIASAGELYNNMIDQQDKLTNSISESRKQILDVSSDEELQNLIKYQAAYNASSRFVTVVDEMLELIVTQL